MRGLKSPGLLFLLNFPQGAMPNVSKQAVDA
jgi:hypothetical protein